jgi:peptidoglycan L-alanyl-D-glutamate endopeptidase CwlK
VFALALQEHFPIYSVIPVSDKRFRKDGRWDDELSMEANNTSAFNYREITGGGRLSNHAYGRAIDINTFQNPYIKNGIVLPHGAKYDPSVAGTLTADHPIVRAFLQLGWVWGGNWTSPKDYQHFEKPLKP